MKRLAVAIVDDSTFVRKALARLLSDDPRVTVVGTAASGEELVANLEGWQPDVITLDLSMPGMGGLLTLDRIRALRPTPVIILSTHSGHGAPQTIEALHRGAMDFIDKQQYSLLDFQALRAVLVEKILQVAGRAAAAASAAAESPPRRAPAAPAPQAPSQRRFDLVVVGASTGGPPAIQQLLEDLGGQVPAPIAIVQHMPVGFTRAFAERLNAHLPLQVREATQAEPLLPGTVYIAPAGQHLRVVRSVGGELRAELGPEPASAAHRPSVDVLFESAVAAAGERTLAVLLTGMGQDGAEGMSRLAVAGAHTIAQDEASSIVHGMPKAAIQRGAAREVVPLGRLGRRLRELLAPVPEPARAPG